MEPIGDIRAPKALQRGPEPVWRILRGPEKGAGGGEEEEEMRAVMGADFLPFCFEGRLF